MITFEKIAKSLGYDKKQNVSLYVEQFNNQSGQDMGNYLQRKVMFDEETREIVPDILQKYDI